MTIDAWGNQSEWAHETIVLTNAVNATSPERLVAIATNANRMRAWEQIGALMLGTVLEDFTLLAELEALEPRDFGVVWHQTLCAAIRNADAKADARADGCATETAEPLTVEAVMLELAVRDAHVGAEPRSHVWRDRLDELKKYASKAAPQDVPSLVRGWARELRRIRQDIERAHAAADEAGRAEDEIDDIALRDCEPDEVASTLRESATEPPPWMDTSSSAPSGSTEPARGARPRWHRCPDLVDAILVRASETWPALRLGADEIVRVRPGGIAVLMGPTGAGKTSLAAGILIAHVAEGGVAIVLSRELPADEFVARTIGMQCDASWTDVLTGRVARADMLRVTCERMFVLDREHATLDELESAIQCARAEQPEAPILVAIDYVQILESSERDARSRVTDIVGRIDRIGRAHRVVVLALSQMSRAASRAARNGEAMGANSTDGGAESAAIERAATVTLAIGTSGEEREDGTRAVELSVGKGRMTGGDSVLPMSYCGRTGRWRLEGEARSATDVRAEKAGKRDAALLDAAVRAMIGGARASHEPVTRARLAEIAVTAMGKCPRDIQRQAIAQLLARGGLAEVRRKPPKARSWLIWTPEHAAATGIPLVGAAP
ncbi:MAG TPA: DnaB-like helicase C-terminal domain-containing protein [Kofleriaceae bacterium]